MNTYSKSEPINMNASTPAEQLLKRGARVEHKNAGDFLLETDERALSQTLADRTSFELSADDWAAFQAALQQPARQKPKLQKMLSKPGLLG